jgi:mono/diheme cytochrome c family protein
LIKINVSDARTVDPLRQHLRGLIVMKLAACGIALTFFILGSAAVAKTTVSYDSALITRGHTIAREHCARCHGIGPTDQSPFEEAPPFSHIAERYPIENLAEAFAEGILIGHKEMPPFEFRPRDIDALLAYLGSLEPPPQ